ncbi:hypothetical protein AGDE_12550 [Angomonas deanei]|uniref:Alpha-kinase family, putative n=1 Tax=Angomonas deanei TaxID=59799 RepID=A0A7G2CBP0_9TRYP|nr:hypothetical protein AGDE_12550 [Angomonas deanei]CAD2217198.1 Alpha-kinase family, putative [Angomonas deanei]|eukprot:EPY24045.1 hypothetical protein AGDE_12550 [Angomonas deanei]
MEKNSSPSASPPPAKDVGECSVGPLTTTGVLMVQDVDQVTSGAYDSAHSRANSNLPLTPMLSREFSAFSGTDAKTNAVRSVALPSNQRDNSEIRKKQRRKMKRVRKRKSKMTSTDRKRHAERREKRQARLKHRPSASMQKLPAVLPKSEEITPPLANFTRPTSAAHFSPPPKSKQEPEHFTRSVSPSLSEPREVAKKDEIAAARQPLDEPKEVVAGAGAAAVLALRQAKAEPGKLSLSSSRTSCSSAEERQKGRADQSRSCSSRSYSYSHSRSLHSDRYQAGSSYSDSYSYSYSDSVSFDPRTAVLPFKKGFTNAPPKRLFTDVKFRLPQKLYLEPYAENAFIYEWNLREGCWNKVQTTVVLFPEPFSHGNMRASYYIIDMNRLNCPLVAKRYLKKTVDDSQYFDDVSMHSISGHWARLFNAAGPPKKVKFIPAAVLELPDRPLILALEPQLDGTFKKYNNNCGYVPRDARWTPQAFSHFTYHASNHELLIVDIQGVDDIYTDPQILSPDGEGYGRGNLGAKGIQRFIESHKCNGVCKHLGLPPINAKPTDPKTKQGVVEGGKSKDVVAIESERLPPKVYVKSEQHISTSPTPVAQLAPYPARSPLLGTPSATIPSF